MNDARGTDIDWPGKADGVSWVIGQLLENWSEALDEADRQSLIAPLLASATRAPGSPAVEGWLGGMAANRLMRLHTATWLRLANLPDLADTLAEQLGYARIAHYPDIVKLIDLTLQSVRPVLAIERMRPALTRNDHYDLTREIDAASGLWSIAETVASRAVAASGVVALSLAAGSTSPAGTPADPFFGLEDICQAAATIAAGRSAWRRYVQTAPDRSWDMLQVYAADALLATTESLKSACVDLVKDMIELVRRDVVAN